MQFQKKFFKIIISLFVVIFTFSACSTTKNASNNPIKNNQNVIKVNYIDVGQGDSELIQVNGKNLLIDAGPNESIDKLMSYLSKQNIKKIDYVIATHPDEDHIGGMSSVIKKYDIGEFYAPKKLTNTRTFENMVTALKSKNLKINAGKAGMDLDLGKNVTCQMLAPNNDKYKDTNNYSIVLKITYGESKFLFTGDAEKISETEMLSKNFDLSADVLKVGHHGSTSSSSKEFLDKVNPKIAVISCGKNNKYGHPHSQTLTQLKNRKAQIYRTDVDGSIVLLSDGKKIAKQ
ncbi:hydrolase [Clostridium carboxidivorans P7]|uniref:Beta-lactamase domain protein n=1 Tax=Clostridium carboxidivorans P7 TaxID=536227 RepID=C6PZB5_9CLOT|nr:ComEC/Rec2 family competence protein [Clostridium carboxidivorans]AKN33515.1 hydrolase [Clostridium carboxidivorans P7]EET85432.1 beta-lactamase domain protein [Clostridium carboxidivorans P7]